MAHPEPTPQSAADRKAAEAELAALVVRLAPEHEKLIVATRRWLKKRLPTAHEIVYEYRDAFVVSYSPDDRGYEGALAIRAGAKGVDLYFNRGKELPDPGKVLRGSGNQTRYVHVEDASALAEPAVVRLVDEAIARHRVPYAPGGRGPIVVRSTAAKRRTR